MHHRLCGWFCHFLICAVALTLVETAEAAQARLYSRYRPNRPSQRLLLRSNSHKKKRAVQSAEVVRVLAIRVEFVADTSDQSTGTGKFLLQPDANLVIDPPPHNRTYFAAQMAALKNYYESVSRGNLLLAPEVMPTGENEAYQLSQPMAYYAPGRDDPLSDQRLAELFRDSFQKADQQDGIDFSSYDSFVIFHAGIGEDFNEDIDDTPNDVPSAFLTLDDLRQALADGDPNFQGIPVQNGSFYIEDGLLLPEMQSREVSGSGLFEFGLLGTSTLLFGNQLGLPSLFNTANGAAGIGYFGLMDQGSNNYQGLMPAQPCAWSKVFLGWEEPIVVTQGENVEVAAALHNNPNKIYKIPITETEYFLVENRQRDVNSDRVAIGRDVNGKRVEFKENSFLAEPGLSVITQIDEYDFGLPYVLQTSTQAFPGVGILIWHIDEAVIQKGYAGNTVNVDINHRGVDLEEADGAQDIGRFYGFLSAGAGSELGVPEDAWWKDNPIITEFLRPDEPVAFGPATQPSTASNAGLNSGITITNFSDIKNVMTFSVRNNFAVANFPQYAGGSVDFQAPMLGDLTGDGRAEFVAASSNGDIYSWRFDGSKVIANQDSATITQPNGKNRRVPAALFAQAQQRLNTPPVLVDLNSDARAEVVTAGDDGKVKAWCAVDEDGNGRADLIWTIDLNSAVHANLAAASDGNTLYCGTVDGRVLALAADGTINWATNLGAPITGISLSANNEVIAASETGIHRLSRDGSLQGESLERDTITGACAVADLQNDGTFETIYLTQSGQLHVLDQELAAVSGFPVALEFETVNGLAVGDIDNDGRKEIVVASGNQIYAFDDNGVLTQFFPNLIATSVNSQARFELSPILADVDGDRIQDILITGVDGNAYAYRFDGTLVAGFPLAMTGPGRGSLAVADFDEDGKLELAGISGEGFLYVWRLPESGNEAAWPMSLYDATHSSRTLRREEPKVVAGDLMPANLVYNYPNPTQGNSTRIRYRLNETATVTITVIDAAGDLVAELQGPGVSQADNEVEWRLDGIESGVYLARVQAAGESSTAVKIIKIAVMK